MSTPSLRRNVRLIDGHGAGRRFIAAQLYRDYPAIELDNIETRWSEAREQVASAGLVAGLAPLEHADGIGVTRRIL